MDLKAIKPYRILIKEVGQRHCIDPALIAAIISRESHGGAVLQNGWDHKGQRFGLMQVGSQRLSITPTSALHAEAQKSIPGWNTQVSGRTLFCDTCGVSYKIAIGHFFKMFPIYGNYSKPTIPVPIKNNTNNFSIENIL